MAKVAGYIYFKGYLHWSPLNNNKVNFLNESIITCCARRIELHIGPSSSSNGALQGS
jgi:hypothetical protein